jgi:two-component system NtrC family sensor kinase
MLVKPRPQPNIFKRLIRSVILHRSWRLVLWAICAALIGLSLRASIKEIDKHNLEVASEGARNVFRMIVLARQWNANHQGVYVPVDEKTQANPYLTAPQRDITTSDGRALTLVNPAYMTRMISEMSKLDSEVSFRSTSLHPINPQNAPDVWEREALLSFANGVREVKGLTVKEAGETIFRYIAPLTVSKDCLGCHAAQEYVVGDIRGGISISQNYAPFLQAARPSERASIISHLLVFLLFAALSGWAMERLRTSWQELEENIDELEKTRDDLVQNEKMASLGRMVAGFAHELNTPVGIALGSISHNEATLNDIDVLLKTEEVSEEELRERLGALRHGGELALSNLKRAANLVQRFKRSSIDQASEQTRIFFVRELIDDVVFSLHSQLKKAPTRVTTKCPEKLAVDGSPGLLDQVLSNLLLNSLQHGFAKGTRPGKISISADAETPGHLHIIYSDNGAGMSSEAAQRIFEPFFTTARNQGGSGLGMFICYNIISEQLRGTITCESNPGEGVRFDISYPCVFVDSTQQGKRA